MRFIKRLFPSRYRVDKDDDGLLHVRQKRIFHLIWLHIGVANNMVEAMKLIDENRFPEQRVTIHKNN